MKNSLFIAGLVVILLAGCTASSRTIQANYNYGPYEKTFVSKTINAKFVLIPSGTFLMGWPGPDKEKLQPYGPDERQHPVTISKPFYMQTTEVTQGQWKTIMGNNPSWFKKCGDNCPVEKVSWYDVQDFIKKLNQLEGTNKYRLPTEAEWEYAARAGTTTRFNTGNCLLDTQANFSHGSRLSDFRDCPRPKKSENPKTLPVGSFAPNAWGLYDTHGNVKEWTRDWYGEFPFFLRHLTDPTGPSTGSRIAIKGGGWGSIAWDCRPADRGRRHPKARDEDLGFRLVKEVL
jgi:formylglycine-generating enzyme required for sulfatase activity